MQNITITSDGEHVLNSKHKESKSVLFISGNLGGAVPTLIYKNSEGVNLPLEDGILASGRQYVVEHGLGIKLYLDVTGTTGASDFEVIITGIE